MLVNRFAIYKESRGIETKDNSQARKIHPEPDLAPDFGQLRSTSVIRDGAPPQGRLLQRGAREYSRPEAQNRPGTQARAANVIGSTATTLRRALDMTRVKM